MRYLMTALVVGLAVTLVGCAGAAKGPSGAGTVVARVSPGAEKVYTDRNGLTWSADQEYGPGKTWGAVGGNMLWRESLTQPPPGPAPDMLITERWSMSAYRFDLPDGRYTVCLHFIEHYEKHSKAGDRIFDVKVQGKTVLKDFDIFREAGGFNKPVVRKFTDVAVTDGKLMIEFVANVQNPCIHGIEVFKP